MNKYDITIENTKIGYCTTLRAQGLDQVEEVSNRFSNRADYRLYFRQHVTPEEQRQKDDRRFRVKERINASTIKTLTL